MMDFDPAGDSWAMTTLDVSVTKSKPDGLILPRDTSNRKYFY